MRILLVLLVVCVLQVNCDIYGKYITLKVGAGTFNVKDYGAKGDGKTVDTSAIQAAFDAAGKAGGGTVQFDSGTYLTFPFKFSGSKTTMNVASGAKVLASDDISKWPGGKSDPTHFITASSLDNVGITGKGVIDGNGAKWWPNKSDPRPNLVNFKSCTNVLFDDTTFQNSANHNLEMYSDHTELKGISVLAPSSAPNTDGVDVHGQPFYIHDSTINVGDDNVAAHDSNLLVDNCNFGTGHGASIGSISSGTYKNLTFKSITFSKTTQAVRIKTDPGASGSISDVTYDSLTFNDVGTGIVIDMFYDKGPTKDTTMKISNIKFSNIKGSVSSDLGTLNCQPSSPCKDIAFSSINLTPTSKKWTCENISGSESNVSPKTCIKT